MKIADLRSDTFTKPSKPMLESMFQAEVGDDVFGEDPTVNKLESKIASLFGMEAAIYCPSGTQTNQIGIRVHTNPGDEVICDTDSHIYRFEGGGISYNSLVSVRLVNGDRGRITAKDIYENINPENIHQPRTTLVSLENTSNKGGGSCYNFDEILKIKKACTENNLKLHLDGARLFNALAVSGETPKQYGEVFDSISICFSKGLGTPVGSILLGTKDFIFEARRVRKVFGGAMRQSGFLAAACIYALDHNIERLVEDHKKTKVIADTLKECDYVSSVFEPETNILIFKLIDAVSNELFLSELEKHNIKAIGFGPKQIRMVTHLDFTDEMLNHTIKSLKELKF